MKRKTKYCMAQSSIRGIHDCHDVKDQFTINSCGFQKLLELERMTKNSEEPILTFQISIDRGFKNSSIVIVSVVNICFLS